MKRIAILLADTGIASAASAQAQPAPGGCSAIEVTAPGLRKQPRELRFSTREILDLDFETRLERKVQDGKHVLHFKVLTPSGFLYQDLAMPFRLGPAGPPRTPPSRRRRPSPAACRPGARQLSRRPRSARGRRCAPGCRWPGRRSR